jgi:hypothetical protein
MPLKLDSSGYPKRPIVTDWTNIRHWMPDIDALPWEGAAGLGILLGPTSDNLAVIDIDSHSLARAVYQIVKSHDQRVYAVRTGRKNMHLYLKEITPSPSSKFLIMWEGKELYIEFKAQGTQVAAPPSPGYTIIHDDLLEWQNLATFWELLDHRLRYLHPDRYQSAPSKEAGASQGTTPWKEQVSDGSRNNTLYVEAHKLREAGMPLQEAVAILTARIRQSYEGGSQIPEQEIRQTVASAYRKGVETKIGDTAGPSELDLL